MKSAEQRREDGFEPIEVETKRLVAFYFPNLCGCHSFGVWDLMRAFYSLDIFVIIFPGRFLCYSQQEITDFLMTPLSVPTRMTGRL